MPHSANIIDSLDTVRVAASQSTEPQHCAKLNWPSSAFLWLSFQATQILNDLAELLRNCNLATCLQTSMVVCSGCCPTHTATAKALSLVSSLVDLSCSTHLQQGEDIDHALYKHTQAIQRVKLAINQSLQYPSRSPSSGFLDGLRILIFQVQIFQLARGWEAVIHRG